MENLNTLYDNLAISLGLIERGLNAKERSKEVSALAGKLFVKDNKLNLQAIREFKEHTGIKLTWTRTDNSYIAGLHLGKIAVEFYTGYINSI